MARNNPVVRLIPVTMFDKECCIAITIDRSIDPFGLAMSFWDHEEMEFAKRTGQAPKSVGVFRVPLEM